MSELRQKLRATLEELHQELEQLPPEDPEVRHMLTRIAEEIRARLDSTSQQTSPPVIDRVRDAAKQFEATHPTLSATLGSVVDTLSQMGI